ncbi:HNH endonuclease [Agrobacterium tumefaciens]|uniref:HNH endonuclease n=1 Tax=Agrobacterium tumefaciens TaxID=358 RepID=UPI003BA113D4
MARTVDEWIGKTDDAKVPPRVRQRVFDRHNGICHLTGRAIQPGEKWELEHVHALILGGQHRESNMAPALAAAHKVKTATEMKVKSKIARVRKKHIGIAKPKSSLSHPNLKRLMDGTVVDRRTGEIVGGRQP